MIYIGIFAQLLSHGIELAEEIYELRSSGVDVQSRLTELLPITTAEARRYIRTAEELCGPLPEKERAIRDGTVELCRAKRVDFNRLVMIGIMTRKVPREHRIQREQLRRTLVERAMDYDLTELKNWGDHLTREIRETLPRPRVRPTLHHSAKADADGRKYIKITGPDVLLSRMITTINERAVAMWRKDRSQPMDELKFHALSQLIYQGGTASSPMPEDDHLANPLRSLLHQPAVIITAPELNKEALIDDSEGRKWFATTDGALVSLSEYSTMKLSDYGWAVVIGGDHQILDLQRIHRGFSPAQKAAQTIAQVVCAAPGCSRSAALSDAHHLVPWMKNGPTNMDNLSMLCSCCHGKMGHSADLERTADGRYLWRTLSGKTRMSRLAIEEYNGGSLARVQLAMN